MPEYMVFVVGCVISGSGGEWRDVHVLYILNARNNECVLVSCDVVSLVLYRASSCAYLLGAQRGAQPTPFLVYLHAAVRAEYIARAD